MDGGDSEGYKCERCGFTVTGLNAKWQFRDHVMLHEHRLNGYGSLRTAFNAVDRVILSVNKIKNDFEDNDAA